MKPLTLILAAVPVGRRWRGLKIRHYGYRNPFCYSILKVCYLFLKRLGMGLGPT